MWARVPSIEAFLHKTIPLYGELTRGPMIVNERQQVRELCLTDGATTVELLEPLAESSPLRSFLRRNRSGGLVHLALEVVDLDATIARVTASVGGCSWAPSRRGLRGAQDCVRPPRRPGHRAGRDLAPLKNASHKPSSRVTALKRSVAPQLAAAPGLTGSHRSALLPARCRPPRAGSTQGQGFDPKKAGFCER